MEDRVHEKAGFLTLAGHQVVSFLDYMGDLALFLVAAIWGLSPWAWCWWRLLLWVWFWLCRA
ncbi:MAG: hypothetical protein P8X65_11520 [Syntrophobacterales bacterium]